MKKIYLGIAALCLSTSLNAQDAFWTPTNYKGAFPVTDATPATDWTAGWSNFDPENTVYPATTQTVSTDITTNTTWSGVILLQNKVYVKNNATLTIAPGTIIRGDKASQGTLIITRGAKINAAGTASNPIVFTSNESVGNRAEGDWGGIVILGLAKNNQPGGVASIEGLVPSTDTQFGGAFDNDNSGVLQYVRVEFPGIPLEPNKELNGITFGSVGSGTTVDHIQVSFSSDDSYEWFGGTVNCKYLIVYRGLDDDFDTDFGYRGKVQFGLAIRDKDLSDAPGDSNCFESDNDAQGSAAQPKTAPIFSNITIVGPKGDGTTILPSGEKFEKAFRLRRNTATSCFNSLVTGWEKGLSMEGTAVVNNVNGDTLVFANNILTNFNAGVNTIYNAGTSGGASSNAAFYSSFWTANGNDSTATLAQVNWVNLFPALGNTPDARLNAGSVAATNASFMDDKFYSVVRPTVATTSFTYCQGETNVSPLTATTLVGNSLRWYNQATGGTFSTTAPSPSTASAGNFTYYVSQVNANGDESKRVAISVTINALPSIPTITASGNTSFCTGGSVVLTSSASAGNVWSTSATTTSITVTSSGSYTVTVTDANQCSATSTTTVVNVSSSPAPTINASATAACSGQTVTLTSSTADTYLWSNNATTQSIQVSATGNYTVTTTNADACNGVGASTPTTVTFTTTPTANGAVSVTGNTATFTNTSSNATSYSWDFGDFSNSSASAPVHAYAANGSYTVILTAINGNCTDTDTLTVAITVSLEELAGVENIKVYPNPATESFVVAFDNQNNEAVVIEMIDQMGRVIQSNSIEQTGVQVAEFNTSNVSNGMYSIRISSNGNTLTKRMIVNK
ncbi:MAG: T9SS type A sorting domain-containing protein [Flavobacteriales bacterium]|nr:T9SS type A sorting domain-containing protein [Flavobacteriales bacterium]